VQFPSETIQAKEGWYSANRGPFGLAAISIGLAPFEFDGELHNTSLQCDQISLDLADFSALTGKTFEFPPNPEPGYIDGSIYLFGVHVLFLTKRLSFGHMDEDTIALGIEGTLEFSTSGLKRYQDASLLLDAFLPLPLTPAGLTSLAATAIDQVAAGSSRDIGKVMALLAQERRASDRMAELNAEVRRLLQERDAAAKIPL
jgi:hypothetical protein